MGQFFEYIKISLKSIRDNKMRSVLTMFGIVVGISSVITVVSLGNGVKGTITGEMNSMFSAQTYIKAGTATESYEEAVMNREDIEAVRENVEGIAVFSMDDSYGVEIVNGKEEAYTYVVGCNEDYVKTENEGFLCGRFFNKEEYEDGKRVCVINESGAKQIFGHTSVVGQSITFRMMDGKEADYFIVGVRKAKESALYSMGAGEGIDIKVPYTAIANDYGIGPEDDNFYSVMLMPENANDAKTVIRSAIKLLEIRKGIRGQKKLTYTSFTSVMDKVNMIINAVTIFISFIAAISLVVGGVGVMNIMLVSVTERTQEIGIRKALGARTSSIMIQFLAESAVLTAVGGIFGIIIGYLGAELLCFIASKIIKMNVVATISPLVVLLVVGFSAAIGIFFGLHPAKKAARLNPIEALRQE